MSNSKPPPTHTLHWHTLADLHARVWTDNPRRSDLEALAGTLRRFGYVEPLVVDDTSGQLIKGHGVLAALVLAQEDGNSPPARVSVQGDEWTVQVVRVQLAEGEAQAYTLAAARTSELGSWDDERLAAQLQALAATDLGLDGLGWSESEVEALLAGLHGELPGSFNQLPDPEPPAQASKTLTCPHCGETFTA